MSVEIVELEAKIAQAKRFLAAGMDVDTSTAIRGLIADLEAKLAALIQTDASPGADG